MNTKLDWHVPYVINFGDDSSSVEATPVAPVAPAPPQPTFVCPAQGIIKSGYGPRWGTFHYGVDIANKIGTPIRAAYAGKVINTGPAQGFGLWIRIRHLDGNVTVYGHIDRSLVELEQEVTTGQEIALMGNRGQSTGPHLHFEVQVDSQKIDPVSWLAAKGVTC